MADFDFDFEPPSFSLGFDLDLQSEPPQPDPLSAPAKRSSAAANLRTVHEDDDDFESPVRVSDPQVSDPARALKRIRRGPTARKVGSEGVRCNVDDDIEDFSSDEEWPRGNASTNSVCSSSKSSLHGQRVLTSESGSQWKSVKKNDFSNASAPANLEMNDSNVIFPKLTVSPLRRFQLIDSDSDDPSVSEDIPPVALSSKGKQSNYSKHTAFGDLGAKNPSVGKYQTEDLWKDFCSEKSSHIPTPAFDEVFEEYFTSVNNKGKAQIDPKDPNNGTKWNVASHPPSHSYFFHNDSRIQKLVRNRLPYFFPLGAGNNQEYKQRNASVIDYMGQFGNEENPKQTDGRRSVEKSSTRSRKNVKKAQVDNISQDSENWVNPKNCAGLPKNAGNRRVQAVSKSTGHWFTGSDGRRVYVSKNGQELTGRMAYVNYKKESGMGFKNSKKKAAGGGRLSAGMVATLFWIDETDELANVTGGAWAVVEDEATVGVRALINTRALPIIARISARSLFICL
ncbi:hypothetical protein BUALT_Bualt03G0117000 [Buddleja alternifolia]|uniref:Uncharacterized protein n=1 Tax=Buddleja alternifolia TaxID=168488 RepID=A0AAV6Y485_9LAMI|nr:hypothetical protein BUALT_Bualt03G0117000 [Buddleja alternifolia]